MNSSNNKEVYPGMRVLATRLFNETPVAERSELTKKLKLILQNAKLKGVATKLNWANESLDSLTKQFLPGAETAGSKRPNTEFSSKKKLTKSNNDDFFKFENEDTYTAHPSSSPIYESVSDDDEPNTKRSYFGFKVDTKPDPKYTKESKQKSANTNTLQNKAKSSREQRFQTKPAMMPYVDGQLTHTIVGTCLELEKPYFRLTGQVNPAVVRPPEVLQQALHKLQTNPRDNSYSYILDQLKAIRQDLTVQHVQSELTAEVYEFNTRIAIKNNDLGEVNKCLTQLLHQYNEQPEVHKLRRYEFMAYMVYYRLYTHKWDELSVMLRQFYENKDVQTLITAGKSGSKGKKGKHPAKKECVQMYTRALSVISLVQMQDIYSLYTIFEGAYEHEKALLKYIIERIQLQVLKSVFTATFAREQRLPVAQLGLLVGSKNCTALLTKLGIDIDETGFVASKQGLEKLAGNMDFVDLKGQK